MNTNHQIGTCIQFPIQTESGQNGFYAIRAALILASADPQGLTLLNVMRYYPNNSIRINLSKIF